MRTSHCPRHVAPFTSAKRPARLVGGAHRARCRPVIDRSRQVWCASGGSGDADEAEEQTAPQQNALSATIRRKHQQIKARLEALGLEALEEQLQTAVTTQTTTPEFRLTHLISTVRAQHGRPAVILEVRRSSRITTPQQLAEAATAAVAAGADAVAIPTDAEASPTGLSDLFAVCQALRGQIPVVARDWYLHPLQVVDAKEAGAAAVLGVIASVTSNGTSVLSSFAAALGMEAPVEIVNQQESDEAEKLNIPFIAINVAVGLSLSMPSLGLQIAQALVQKQPFGNLTLVGVRTFEEARAAQVAGADALFLRADFCESNFEQLSRYVRDNADPQQAVLEDLLDLLCGAD